MFIHTSLVGVNYHRRTRAGAMSLVNYCTYNMCVHVFAYIYTYNCKSRLYVYIYTRLFIAHNTYATHFVRVYISISCVYMYIHGTPKTEFIGLYMYGGGRIYFYFFFFCCAPHTLAHRILYCTVLQNCSKYNTYITLRRIITLSSSRFVYHATRLDRSFKLPCPKINLKKINVDALRLYTYIILYALLRPRRSI